MGLLSFSDRLVLFFVGFMLTICLPAQIVLMQTVFPCLDLPAFFFLCGGIFRIHRLRRRHEVADEREVDVDSLGSLTAPFTVTVIDDDFIDQLIGHGSSQMIEILILAYKTHEPFGLVGPVGVIINGRSQCADFLLKGRAFAFILITEDMIPLVRQLAEDVVLIDLADEHFKLLNSVLALCQALSL